MYKINFCFIFVCALICLAVAGCNMQKIEFKRESAFQNTMKNIGMPQKNTTTNSKNIYIYSYEDNKKTDNTNINFGPKEVNFEPPSRFK